MNDRSVVLPPTMAPDGTRHRILQAAVLLFAKRGYHGSSMRELAAIVELQVSALYVHFPSKEDVLSELVRAGHETHHQALRTAMLEAGTDPVAQLSGLVRANIRMHATYPHLAIVVNAEMGALSPKLAAPGIALRKQSLALLREILERGVAKGQFVFGSTQVVAAAIGAMGLRVPYWYSADSGLSVEQLADECVVLCLRMVGVRS